MHYWNSTPASAGSSTWPGVPMTNEGNGWYSYTLADATCTNIVFNDNGGAQTADLNRCGEGWYDNGWSDTAPRVTSVTTMGNEAPRLYPNPTQQGQASLDFRLAQAQA